MYYSSLETSAIRMSRHNDLQKSLAAARLGKLEHKCRYDCAENRTAAKRLQARVQDWERTINDPANRSKVMTGYNKPGSMKVV